VGHGNEEEKYEKAEENINPKVLSKIKDLIGL